ncbi:unnamed protein product [Notodromas monacha]|uniref:Transmembrane protein 47 n=1 Tax=Notodromas monacha TaxID=399045 RepID=A0A7R9BR63_9CRUS|nr:unnamed protein product [Notodromas monacha]CAG0918815.1 unnamed protein product [Notodromas monacha]
MSTANIAEFPRVSHVRSDDRGLKLCLQRLFPGSWWTIYRRIDACIWYGRLQAAKVIAFICGGLAVFLLILCLASSEWLLAQGWRQGLFVHCVSEDAIHPLPFGIASDQAGCFPIRPAGYIVCSAILCIVAVILDAVATLLTGLGLWSQDSTKKYKFYRFALYVMVASLITVLIALVVYPVCFSGELDQGNRELWEFGWAYGVAWGAAIFLFGGIVLLLLDKESEEIYYKERTVVHESAAGSDAASGSKG